MFCQGAFNLFRLIFDSSYLEHTRQRLYSFHCHPKIVPLCIDSLLHKLKTNILINKPDAELMQCKQ